MGRGIFCGLYHLLDKSKFDLTVWKQERVFSYPSIAAALAIAARWLQSLLVTASFTTDIPEPIVQSNNSPRQGRELAQMHIIPFINTRCLIIAIHFLYCEILCEQILLLCWPNNRVFLGNSPNFVDKSLLCLGHHKIC